MAKTALSYVEMLVEVETMQTAAFILAGALLAFSVNVQAEVHPEVQKSLDYKMPRSTCGDEPTLRGVSTFRDNAEKAAQTDVDHYTRKRHERKHKRWSRCNDKHRDRLMDDFTRLKDSAQHGMTQEQAQVVLGHMKSIQDVLQPKG